MLFATACSGINSCAEALNARMRDISGQRHGRLVSIKPIGRTKIGHVIWECACDCGAKKNVASNSLTRKNGTRSCGCLRREKSSRPKSWNAGATYSIKDDQHEYNQRHAWAKAVLRRDGNKCSRCAWTEGRCDVDHIIPRHRGGRNILTNGRVLCPNCHRTRAIWEKTA